jgi:hypothetical protein
MDDLDFYAALQGTTPEEQDTLVHGVPIGPQRSKLLSEQLALAQTLRTMGQNDHPGGPGGLLNAIAQTMNASNANRIQNQAMGQQSQFANQEDAARQLAWRKFIDVYAKQKQREAQQPAPNQSQQPQAQPASGGDYYDTGFGG